MEPLFPKNKSDTIGNGFFLITLAMMLYYNAWWPWIILALWASIGLRQFLNGRLFDLLFSSIILLGIFFLNYYSIDLSIVIPILLALGGLYMLVRELLFSKESIKDEELPQKELKDDSDSLPK